MGHCTTTSTIKDLRQLRTYPRLHERFDSGHSLAVDHAIRHLLGVKVENILAPLRQVFTTFRCVNGDGVDRLLDGGRCLLLRFQLEGDDYRE